MEFIGYCTKFTLWHIHLQWLRNLYPMCVCVIWLFRPVDKWLWQWTYLFPVTYLFTFTFCIERPPEIYIHNIEVFQIRADLSRLMIKATKWLCFQISVQSSLISLRCPHEESLGPQLPIEGTAKTLIRLGRCLGWPESSLGAHVTLLVLSWGGSTLCCLSNVDESSNLNFERDSNLRPRDLKSGALTARPRGHFRTWRNIKLHKMKIFLTVYFARPEKKT